MLKLLLSTILIFALTPKANAEPVKGLLLEVGAGYDYLEMNNPDNLLATYTGLAGFGRGLIPLIDGDDLGVFFTATLTASDMNNTANASYQSEYANFIGLGPGLSFRAGRWMLGGSYSYNLGRHRTMGAISRETYYYFWTQQAYINYTYPLGKLSFGFEVNYTMGSISKSDIGLSKDMPYAETTYLLMVRYYSGISLGQLFGFSP